MNIDQTRSLIKRYFAGLTEQTFQTQLGVADPMLTDYLTDMLVRFVRCDRIYRIRNVTGKTLGEVAEMLIEAHERVGEARRDAHQHIGDFILFWAGVYPETLQKMRGPGTRDQFIDYCVHGKRAYSIAGRIAQDVQMDDSETVLRRLSEEFELCMYGLGEVRRAWETHEGGESQMPLLVN